MANNDTVNNETPDTRERDRMLSGELYIADDPYLHELGRRRRALQQQINTSAWDAFDERARLFHELFGAFGEGSYIEPPFRYDVFFGPRVALYTPYHPIDADIRSMQLEGGLPIRIGSNVWFGGNVTVCPGVTIGDDVVIGAGSVVTKDIPSHSVAVGNPARVVRGIGGDDRAYWSARVDEYRAWRDAR